MKTWQERADDVFAQGCNTYSKRADQFVEGVFPTHITHGETCYVYDTEGKRYFDTIGGLGSTVIDNRNNFCLPTTSEVELAEKVREIVPFCEKMRFLKSGSEACQAAIRIARAYTKKSAGCGGHYHGWHNWCIAEENPGAGCVDEVYNKTEDANLIDVVKIGRFCYCIIEPVQLDISSEHIEWLKKLRTACTETNTVLIFDEVITGFRVPGYTVAKYSGVTPDLICMGKAMANGFPIAVIGGKREIMDTPGYFVSSTFAGEISAIHAALETIKFLTPDVLTELWAKGERFQKKFNALNGPVKYCGIPTKMVLEGTEENKALYMQEMCKRGILCGKALHITVAQAEKKLNWMISIAEQVFESIENGLTLEGPIPKPVFKRYEEGKKDARNDSKADRSTDSSERPEDKGSAPAEKADVERPKLDTKKQVKERKN